MGGFIGGSVRTLPVRFSTWRAHLGVGLETRAAEAHAQNYSLCKRVQFGRPQR